MPAKNHTFFTALGMRTSTVTGAAAAATLNTESGVITTETGVNTAAGSVYTFTLTNSKIAAADIVLASVAFGTATTGEPILERITPAAGSVVFRIRNVAAAAAFNGSLKIAYAVLKV